MADLLKITTHTTPVRNDRDVISDDSRIKYCFDFELCGVVFSTPWYFGDEQRALKKAQEIADVIGRNVEVRR